METYMSVGYYGSGSHLAPNNVFGRVGATLYKKSDEGMGMAMLGIFGTIVLAMPPLFAFLDGANVWGFILLLPLFLVMFGPLCTAYARLFCQRHENARSMSETREAYRKMTRSDRAIVRPIVENMERCKESRYSYDFDKRRTAFEAFVACTQPKQLAIRDDSDIDSINTFLDGMSQLRREAEKRGLTS